MGVDPKDVRRGEVREAFKVGGLENARRYVSDMLAVLASCAGRVHRRGRVALMVGDATFRGEYLPLTRELVERSPRLRARARARRGARAEVHGGELGRFAAPHEEPDRGLAPRFRRRAATDVNVRAATHPAAYLIHKYWSRKPHNVLRSLFERAPRGLFVNPFCGSGVALSEAAALGFECAGADVNPIARAITGVTLDPPDPRDVAGDVVGAVLGRADRGAGRSVLGTRTRHSGTRAMRQWFAARAGHVGVPVRRGRYACAACGAPVRANLESMVGDGRDRRRDRHAGLRRGPGALRRAGATLRRRHRDVALRRRVSREPADALVRWAHDASSLHAAELRVPRLPGARVPCDRRSPRAASSARAADVRRSRNARGSSRAGTICARAGRLDACRDSGCRPSTSRRIRSCRSGRGSRRSFAVSRTCDRWRTGDRHVLAASASDLFESIAGRRAGARVPGSAVRRLGPLRRVLDDVERLPGVRGDPDADIAVTDRGDREAAWTRYEDAPAPRPRVVADAAGARRRGGGHLQQQGRRARGRHSSARRRPRACSRTASSGWRPRSFPRRRSSRPTGATWATSTACSVAHRGGRRAISRSSRALRRRAPR